MLAPSPPVCVPGGQSRLTRFSPDSLLWGHAQDPPLHLRNADGYASSLVQVTVERDKVLSWRYVSIIEVGSTEKEQKAKFKPSNHQGRSF